MLTLGQTLSDINIELHPYCSRIGRFGIFLKYDKLIDMIQHLKPKFVKLHCCGISARMFQTVLSHCRCKLKVFFNKFLSDKIQ